MIHQMRSQILRPDVHCFPGIVYSNRLSRFGREIYPLKLNLVRPFYEKHVFSKVPLIVWLEGGGWSGNASAYRLPELSFYAYNGFAVADVEYSIASRNLWPDCLRDVKTAIRFLRAHAEEYGIDPDRIVVMGESAGAHLAAMAGLTADEPAYETEEWKEQSDAVSGVMTWYCPGSFPLHAGDEQAQRDKVPGMCELALTGTFFYDDEETVRELSPVCHVKENAPPFLMYHGLLDKTVDHRCSVALHEALTAAGGECELYLIEEAGHADDHFTQEEIQEQILRFARSCTGTEKNL